MPPGIPSTPSATPGSGDRFPLCPLALHRWQKQLPHPSDGWKSTPEGPWLAERAASSQSPRPACVDSPQRGSEGSRPQCLAAVVHTLSAKPPPARARPGRVPAPPLTTSGPEAWALPAAVGCSRGSRAAISSEPRRGPEESSGGAVG